MSPGDREPSLSNGCTSKTFSQVVLQGWRAFCRKGIASFDKNISISWPRDFIPKARAHVDGGEWIVLFIDGCRARSIYYAM